MFIKQENANERGMTEEEVSSQSNHNVWKCKDSSDVVQRHDESRDQG